MKVSLKVQYLISVRVQIRIKFVYLWYTILDQLRT